MSAVGKIQAAWAAASNETTLALANLNFDFSLIKVEAPVEFKDLGAALSIKRRSAAEHGTSHSTARKLGSLFEQILPSTPRLFKAYGLRASEIAQSPLVNPKGNKAYGPFAEHTGVDGTTIWAAATSGTSALAVHLLACMLARIWSASEAIGIWEQILVARKKELLDFSDTGAIHLQSLAAAQLSLSREQLADWDASARAWLRAADAVKKIRQKQLNLIVENLDIPVNRKMDVYTSVMQAWKTAMITMDKLVGGMGHSVQDGSVLLGLSSWHLYPDIIVLGKMTAEMKQGDGLIAPGGIVTIGLQGVNANHDRGVYWSLPLAHVRFYGDPIKAEGSISLDSSRVSIDQLLLVALGSLIASWSPHGSNVKDSLKLLPIMWQSCESEIARNRDSKAKRTFLEMNWLRLLAESSSQYLVSSDRDQEVLRRLINLGQRRAHFFGRYPQPITMFGLTAAALVKIMKDEERKISLLRRLAARCKTDNDSLIIRVRRMLKTDSRTEEPTFEFATALPEEIQDSNDAEKKYRFKRWRERGAAPDGDSKASSDQTNYIEDFLEYHKESIEAAENLTWFEWDNPPNFFRNVPLAETEDQTQFARPTKASSRWKLPKRSSRSDTNKKAKTCAKFEFLYGDLNKAALFRRSDRDIITDDLRVTIADITDAFLSNSIAVKLFLEHLGAKWSLMERVPGQSFSEIRLESSVIQQSLRTLATVVKVYRLLPNATVPLSIVSFGPLSDAQWIRPDLGLVGESDPGLFPTPLLPFSLTRPQTFSCIAMFESGGFNFQPDYLDRVMAISVGDSIYVAAPLLCDPSIQPEPHEVRRIVGNIGRAGLALLIPPTGPKTKQLDVESYQLINHNRFDGKLEDCFQSTTLHLAFSGYELPMDFGEHGGRNREAFFLESLVSVHDRGEWIADLDVLSTFDDPKFQCIVDQPSCLAGRPRQIPSFPLVSIDSWQELLEMPLDAAVVRARNNWLGRLAAASVSVSLGYSAILFTGSACWKCAEKTVERIEHEAVNSADDASRTAPKIVFIL